MTPSAEYYYGSLWRKAYCEDIGIGFKAESFLTISDLCKRLDWKVLDDSHHLYSLAKKPCGQMVVIHELIYEIWCVDVPEYVEEVAKVYKAVRASSRKKSMGRPPLPPGQKRMRLHISLPQDLAKLAIQDPAGPSAYIEKFLRLAALPSP